MSRCDSRKEKHNMESWYASIRFNLILTGTTRSHTIMQNRKRKEKQFIWIHDGMKTEAKNVIYLFISHLITAQTRKSLSLLLNIHALQTSFSLTSIALCLVSCFHLASKLSMSTSTFKIITYAHYILWWFPSHSLYS